jgi:hypothetical protein
MRNERYTYEGFLKAISKYPKFCDEMGDHMPDFEGAEYDLEGACKREMSFMFSHINQETGGHCNPDA